MNLKKALATALRFRKTSVKIDGKPFKKKKKGRGRDVPLIQVQYIKRSKICIKKKNHNHYKSQFIGALGEPGTTQFQFG